MTIVMTRQMTNNKKENFFCTHDTQVNFSIKQKY